MFAITVFTVLILTFIIHVYVCCFEFVVGVALQEFCQYGTKEECQKLNESKEKCERLHFRKIIHKHTDGRII